MKFSLKIIICAVKLITCTFHDKILIGLQLFITFLSFSLITSTHFSHLEKKPSSLVLRNMHSLKFFGKLSNISLNSLITLVNGSLDFEAFFEYNPCNFATLQYCNRYLLLLNFLNKES